MKRAHSRSGNSAQAAAVDAAAAADVGIVTKITESPESMPVPGDFPFQTLTAALQTAPDSQKMANSALRYDWTVPEIESIYSLPLPELIFQAQRLHRENH